MTNNKLQIFHFILGKADKNRANGVNQVIAGLAKYSALHGAEVRVIGKAETVGFEGEIIDRDGFEVQAFSKDNAKLKQAVASAVAWADIIHLHGVFNPNNLWVSNICSKQNKPYVVTLHDGFARDRLIARNKWKKILYHRLLQRSHLEGAAGIHVLTEEEATEVFNWITPQHIFCIPNGIDLEDFPLLAPKTRDSKPTLTIGYLGRISSEKNLDSLCQAVGEIRSTFDICLKIAGPESPYLAELLTKYGDCGVEWVGPMFGDDKRTFITNLDLFVHPTLCDVFSIAAMEVLAIGTPLLITRTAKSSYFYDRNAFFMCEPTVFGLAQGLKRVIGKRDEWTHFTERGRILVEEMLNWSISTRNLLEEYNYILHKNKI